MTGKIPTGESVRCGKHLKLWRETKNSSQPPALSNVSTRGERIVVGGSGRLGLTCRI